MAKEIPPARGAPPKIHMFGPTHRYSPVNVPRELNDLFKRAIKEMNPGLTMADYLRIRVAYDSRKKLKGKLYPPEYCNYNGIIDWKKHRWIKDPKDRMRFTSPVLYPKNLWEIFRHNCAVIGVAPKHMILRYQIQLVEEYIRWRKMRKKKKKKRN